MTIWAILLIILILALIASIPAWPHSRGWGYSPLGLVAAAFLLVIMLWALGIVELQGAEDAADDVIENVDGTATE